jgi:DnaK suppressor protein
MSALTKAQKQQLQRTLRERREVLVNDLHAGVQRLRSESSLALAAGVPDSGDLSSADLDTAIRAGELARDATELHQVESALQRLSSPEFGLCAECGEPIGFPRLSANPAASRCIPCQDKYEREYAGQRAGTL